MKTGYYIFQQGAGQAARSIRRLAGFFKGYKTEIIETAHSLGGLPQPCLCVVSSPHFTHRYGRISCIRPGNLRASERNRLKLYERQGLPGGGYRGPYTCTVNG